MAMESCVCLCRIVYGYVGLCKLVHGYVGMCMPV